MTPNVIKPLTEKKIQSMVEYKLNEPALFIAIRLFPLSYNIKQFSLFLAT